MLLLVLAEGALNHPNSGNQQSFKDLGKKCVSNKYNSHVAFLLNCPSSPTKLLNNLGKCYEEKYAAFRKGKSLGFNLLPFNIANAASIALILRVLSTELFQEKSILHSVYSLSQQTEWEV